MLQEEIKKQFEEILLSSQDWNDDIKLNLDSLFNSWYENKKRFIDKFGGLVYEYPEPVCFSIEEDLQAQNITEFIQNLPSTELSNFININKSGFYQNKVMSPYITTRGQLIPEGAKLVKAFKNFINDPDELASIQNTASHIIQQKEVSGTFCLSVHPIDFLTLSVNKCGWTSCFNLSEGEWRTSVLSYMGDPSTIICYIKTSEGDKVPYGNFEWNSKKWRMLLSISEHEEMIITGRQYPFVSKTILPFIKDILKDLNIIEYFSRWSNACINKVYDDFLGHYLTVKYKHLILRSQFVNIKEIIEQPNYKMQYNDITMMDSWKPCYAYYKWINNVDKIKIHMGSKVDCVCCGQEKKYYTDTFLCDKCEYDYSNTPHLRCGHCNARVEGEDDGSWVVDDWMCDSCYVKLATMCDVCEENIYLDSAYCTDDETIYCEYCYNNRGEE